MISGAEAQTFRIILVEDSLADIYLFREALNAAGQNVELTVISSIPDPAVLDLTCRRAAGLPCWKPCARTEGGRLPQPIL